MKKTLSLILATLMVMLGIPMTAVEVDAATDGYYTYYVSNGEATITDVNTSVGGAVVIPDTLGGYPVTSIGSSAFENCTSLTSVTIPDSVTSIGRSAFYHCSSLTSVTIPDSVTSIGVSAFAACTGLTSITIPDSVTSIGTSAFCNCTGLTSITIPDSVTSIGPSAFYNTGYYNNSSNWEDNVLYIGNHLIVIKTSISGDYSVKDGTITISSNAFYKCTSLTSITIPYSVTGISNGAFKDCTGLTSITLPFVGATKDGTANTHFGYIFGASSSNDNNSYVPSSLKEVIITGGTSFGDDAFFGCDGLTSITIPDSVTSIGYGAFSGCSGLTNITIPDSVTSIGSYAFSRCTGLTSITIPDSVTSIGNSAFYGCTGLTSITIPDSVTTIGNSAFEGCTSLIRIDVDENNAKYKSEDNILFTKDGTQLIKYLSHKTNVSYTIPDSVTSIGDDAFENCSSLTSITIPDSVTTIGNSAFEGCTGLMSITIPDSVTSVGFRAFYGCSGLTSITLPFVGATKDATNNVYFGYIFGLYDRWDAYDYNYIPSSLKKVVITGGNIIDGGAFAYCSSLTSITIPNSVTSIGDYAFYGCTNLFIYCTEGSAAHSAAARQGIPYIFITLASIEITPPTKLTYYVGEELDTAGMAVTAFYNSGTSEVIESGKYAIEGFDSSAVGTKDITVSYNGKTQSFSVTIVEAPKTFVYGDVTGEGKINLADVSLMLKKIAKWDVTLDSDAADVTGDGKINLADVSLLLKYIAKWDVVLGN